MGLKFIVIRTTVMTNRVRIFALSFPEIAIIHAIQVDTQTFAVYKRGVQRTLGEER